MTRPYLESHVRQHVFAQPEVKVLAETDIRGLTASSDDTRITGFISLAAVRTKR